MGDSVVEDFVIGDFVTGDFVMGDFVINPNFRSGPPGNPVPVRLCMQCFHA